MKIALSRIRCRMGLLNDVENVNKRRFPKVIKHKLELRGLRVFCC